jgi:hypothetical protein
MATAAEWMFILGLALPPAIVLVAALAAIASVVRGRRVETPQVHVEAA